ncbi:hypothetical protein PULV_a0838 [Pseudoalteromonas ulvae UL12]|uniref:YqcC family protein n=1 Tax=Pseudoalteromonas ulvae TaxID=107327 RepID=UPI00186B69EB|nr:YqcC family protein [Pseudoalteromonas ulvae]MBE0363405.1 hypothetical protein [Pseudoalteromonas ulvae UL12]
MKDTQVAQLLNELESALKAAKLWQPQAPSQAALLSSAPFCCDTLSFSQWLQFIFIEKMRFMIAAKVPLPTSIALLPMAEQSWSAQSEDYTVLLAIVAQLDNTICGVIS